MKIILNGGQKELAGQMTLTSLINNFCKNPRYVVAELNGAIVKKNGWDDSTLKDGDSVELVNFVGGG